jgi:hypothetical protein
MILGGYLLGGYHGGKNIKKIKASVLKKTFFEPCNICFSKCPPFM